MFFGETHLNSIEVYFMTDNEKLLMSALSSGLKVTNSLLKDGVKLTPQVNRELDEFHKASQAAIIAVSMPKCS